ncbi:MAG: nitroreductase [Pseudanabaena frigida]|uniref:Nitroreductase n=1 Tax=Pseudanabaena frigida TaxID=945775 RepID=A0A2W4XIW6_9CYAN|nr:MAG: nitroreductase [Pseudanabaena frigida]
MSDKQALTDYPIHKFLAERWSPYAFEDRPVAEADLRSLFEAARWSASSYNEQPWSYLVATKENPDDFQKLLSCLAEGNQIWAKNAPVLVLSIASLKFTLNNENNRAAIHDLGLANGNLAVEATARGLCVHQMIGILPDKAREIFKIPQDCEALAGIAIGYQGDPNLLPDAFKERDLVPRQRKPLELFVFGNKWGNSSPLVKR